MLCFLYFSQKLQLNLLNLLYSLQALHTEVERLHLAVEPLGKLIDEVAAANADSDTLRSELNSLQKRLRVVGAALDAFISGLNERERKIEVPLYYVILVCNSSLWCSLQY